MVNILLLNTQVCGNQHNSTIKSKDCVSLILRSVIDKHGQESLKIITQAFFDCGLISKSDECLNLDQIITYVYGVKITNSLSSFYSLFNWLEANNYTVASQNSFNAGGDNLLMSCKNMIKPSSTRHNDDCASVSNSSKINDSALSQKFIRKTIVIKSQVSTFAAIVTEDEQTQQIESVRFVRAETKIKELAMLEFNISNNYNWSAYNLESLDRVITTLDVKSVTANPVFIPKEIEHVIFCIKSGLTATKSHKNVT